MSACEASVPDRGVEEEEEVDVLMRASYGECRCYPNRATYDYMVMERDASYDKWYHWHDRMCHCQFKRLMRKHYPEPRPMPIMPEGVYRYLRQETNLSDTVAVDIVDDLLEMYPRCDLRYPDILRTIGTECNMKERTYLESFYTMAGYPEEEPCSITAVEKDDECAICLEVKPNPVITFGCECGEVRGVCRDCFTRNARKCHLCRKPCSGAATDTGRHDHLCQRYGEKFSEHRLKLVDKSFSYDMDFIEREHERMLQEIGDWHERAFAIAKRRHREVLRGGFPATKFL
jgi:hypothetical protein